MFLDTVDWLLKLLLGHTLAIAIRPGEDHAVDMRLIFHRFPECECPENFLLLSHVAAKDACRNAHPLKATRYTYALLRAYFFWVSISGLNYPR